MNFFGNFCLERKLGWEVAFLACFFKNGRDHVQPKKSTVVSCRLNCIIRPVEQSNENVRCTLENGVILAGVLDLLSLDSSDI